MFVPLKTLREVRSHSRDSISPSTGSDPSRASAYSICLSLVWPQGLFSHEPFCCEVISSVITIHVQCGCLIFRYLLLQSPQTRWLLVREGSCINSTDGQGPVCEVPAFFLNDVVTFTLRTPVYAHFQLYAKQEVLEGLWSEVKHLEQSKGCNVHIKGISNSKDEFIYLPKSMNSQNFHSSALEF